MAFLLKLVKGVYFDLKHTTVWRYKGIIKYVFIYMENKDSVFANIKQMHLNFPLTSIPWDLFPSPVPPVDLSVF